MIVQEDKEKLLINLLMNKNNAKNAILHAKHVQELENLNVFLVSTNLKLLL